MPRTHKWPWIREQLALRPSEEFDNEADELDSLIANPKVRPAAIGKALRSRGFDISDEAIAVKCRKARECL